jgi:16S rRNA G966 N2-methylase RsmD
VTARPFFVLGQKGIKMSSIRIVNRDCITARIEVRKLNEIGINRLMISIKEKGYLERYPIAVSMDGGNSYKLLDGNHRVEAASRLGLDEMPAQVFEDLTPDEEYRIAFESNEGLNTIIPQDWTDHAEFIWRLATLGKTQQDIGGILGWSRGQVSNYQALNKICTDAWKVIVATTKQEFVATDDNATVADNATVVAKVFTEGLLRSIVNLTPDQQLKLVKDLSKEASKGIANKEKFKEQAEKYRARNELLAEAEIQLRGLPEDYLNRAQEEINKGNYDKEWLISKTPGEDFWKLIQQLKGEYAKKSNFQLICADITKLDGEIEPDSVDVIITDPPYGKDYLPLYETLAELANRALKPGGSLLVMIGQSYVPEILNLMTPQITYHWMVSYLTPGGQSAHLWQRNVNTFWKPVLCFVKGEYTGKWIGDVVKSAANDNDKRFHEWGQSESGMSDLVEKFSQPGDTILDPFMGGGTTGVVSLAKGRRFIGIDIEPEKIEISKNRIAKLLQEL